MDDLDYDVTITEDTLEYDADDGHLGELVAAEILAAIAEGIRDITEMSRDGKHRLFNKTGALVSGLTLERSGGAFSVVPPADHFQGKDADKLLARLVGLVPALQNPLAAARVRAAIARSLDRIVRRGPTVTERI